ncbi:MAG TPA: hypothetical protein VE981_11160 [Planctomycetota bacterium]|nr:hypothetical protein [Planctomycetota bacterium]
MKMWPDAKGRLHDLRRWLEAVASDAARDRAQDDGMLSEAGKLYDEHFLDGEQSAALSELGDALRGGAPIVPVLAERCLRLIHPA